LIWVGIDDTDVLDSKGTNQLARAIVGAVYDDWQCVRIVRHQLLDDPRVPYTSKNGSASIALKPRGLGDLGSLADSCKTVLRDWFVDGSDPGLCVTTEVPQPVIEFGLRCQREVVSQSASRELAAHHAIYLEGLGGTNDGVIGALAAVGLAVTGDDGRIVQLGEWADDLTGVQPLEILHRRGVDVRDVETSARIDGGCVDLGKRLRPNLRGGRSVLFVRRTSQAELPAECSYEAVRLP